jgi:nicotinamide-nucleotide amidase
MRIELICTGDELLTGDITDTNASWLASQLTDQGFKLSYKTTVADDLEELVETFKQRSKYADFIIVNGGLGPTTDDLSAQAAAQALGEPVVLFESWLETMKAMFIKMGRHMTDSNIKQAMLPKNCEIVDNPVGTACGFKIKLGKATLVFTPGVPREFKHMVKEQILPLLVAANDAQPLSIKRFLCLGVGESALATLLEDVTLPKGCEFGYRAAMPFIELKIFSKGEVSMQAQVEQVADIVGDYCVVRDGNSLSRHVHQLLFDKAQAQEGFKFGTVESCTGGMVASSLVEYPGSSWYLDRGLVTYSNTAKRQLADVTKETLDAVGAVSIETAREMAQGAVKKHDLDLVVSITGVAGPDGGSDEKPVGTVAFALADKDNCYSQMLLIPNRGRTNVRATACAIALDMVRRYVEGVEVIGGYQSYKAVGIKR